MEYLDMVDKKGIYNDGVGFVELWDLSRCNTNSESRIECVSKIASTCYGKPPKDAKKLVERLWTESGGLPSSVFEFIRAGDAWTTIDAGPEEDPDLYGIECSLRNLRDLQTDTDWVAERMREEVPYDFEFGFNQHRANIATFKIKMPIFLARQVMRHRQYSYQELSRRRTGEDRVPIEFWVPAFHDKPEARKVMLDSAAMSYAAYKQLLKLGVRQEVARAVLPLLTYTETWMMGDALAWKNYFKLRLDLHTQKEHREVAQAMLDLLEEHQPELWEKVKP